VRAPNEVVGERVRALRLKRGLSQRDLAARVQALGVRVHHPGIGKVEQGQRRLDVSELFAFAFALDVAPVHLMVPDDDEGVAVTPEVTVQRSSNLRRWIRGDVSLEGQDGIAFHTVAIPEGSQFETFVSASAAHNEVVALADSLRDAVMRQNPADVHTFARELANLVERVRDDFGVGTEWEESLSYGEDEA
jgi:transcriptional regulator with XRE-family HTH domain